MVKKRQHLSHTLHSEFSEYSSLLRALRTTNTLDVASQLTQSQRTSIYDDADDIELSDEGAGGLPVDEQPPETQTPDPSCPPDSPSSSLAPSRKRRRQQTASESPDNTPTAKKQRKHDTWTRWPLLAGDVVIPEWSFEDEVKLIAKHALRRSKASLPSSHPGGAPAEPANDQPNQAQRDTPRGSDLDEDDDLESVSWPQPLAEVVEHFLSRILAVLAAHVPLTERSMQNRINPLNWEVVLDVLGSYCGPDACGRRGIVDHKTLATVKQRLEAIYGPSKSAAPTRIAKRDDAARKLRDRLKPFELSYLELAEDPSPSIPLPGTLFFPNPVATVDI
ncbi:hypothetical protein HGRIS_012371 [Hohenbuehelia grisea]|uniref:Uncharacterized protein n=1 Tax=Hohenbuehelia grisea TaxID=104357 RepID=A0ABR3IS92_9AGAR